MDEIFEVVTGQILLSHRDKFFELHASTLLPIMREIGIVPQLLLITEIGRYGRFLDVYRYNGMHDYLRLTAKLLAHPSMPNYYREIGQCIDGSIQVEIMKSLPYAGSWTHE